MNVTSGFRILIIAILFPVRLLAVDETSQETANRQFETHIRPLLTQHCERCHGEKKQWSGLRVDSREALLKGGDRGPAIVPGDAERSLLIQAVRHQGDAPAMPEEGQLTNREIEALEEWIRTGAHYPNGKISTQIARDPNHWAFQSLADAQPPEVIETSWIRTPIDRFILAKLEAARLAPSPPADRVTLIRRLTFDLTGLPPTPEEVDSFLADDRPDAYGHLVDRLMETPAYGEHWGRHWLDVARYADSNGLDENIAHGNAWRYRDYVVESFREDKPFDQFLIEQLAGDLLTADDPHTRRQQLTATGFLSIGPKVLAEVDQPRMRMDIVDEQIDSVGRVFLGLTLGCARCHDHKFDPIGADDYYGLAGIFRSTKTMDSYVKVAKWHEHQLPGDEAVQIQAAFEQDIVQRKQQIASLTEAEVQRLRTSRASGDTVEIPESEFSAEARAELGKLREQLAAKEKEGPELPSAMGVTEDEISDVAIHLRGDPLRLGDVVARRVPSVLRGREEIAFPSTHSGREQLARWLVDPSHPLTSRVIVNRVWRWHFGRGIVRTTDNFGLLGEKPTHPELLDWLAREFVNGGWSMKSLHRLILNSNTWQQSSAASETVIKGDPDNQLLSRMRLRRLTAEEVRDSLLAVSGRLDSTQGGPVLKVKNRGYLFDHTSIDLTDYTSDRRSLYLPVIRNNVYDLFQLLDFPDPAIPSGDRVTSTVAPQALLMMNSDFVLQMADSLSDRIHRESESESMRIARLVQLSFGRPATDQEQQQYSAFLAQADTSLMSLNVEESVRKRMAWSVLCHTLLASNEFIYLK